MLPANSDTFRIPNVVKQRTWATRLRDLAAALLVLW
jgi:hypothetical protein